MYVVNGQNTVPMNIADLTMLIFFFPQVPGGQPNAGEEPRFPPAPSTSDGNVQRNLQTDSGMYGQFESPLVLMRTLTSLVL